MRLIFIILMVCLSFLQIGVPLVHGQASLPCTCDIGPESGQQFFPDANGKCNDSNGSICRQADLTPGTPATPGTPGTPVPPPPPAPSPDDPSPPIVKGDRADVILLMDVSGSMEAVMEGQNIIKLEAAKTALIDVVDKMVDAARFQLWTFSAKVIQQPVSMSKGTPSKRGKFSPIGPRNSETRQVLKDMIKAIGIPKDATVTNLYAAILQAMQYYYSSAYNALESGQAPTKVVVVLSDGQDDQLSPIKIGRVLIAKGAFPEIQIKTIGFGIKPDDPFHKELCYLSTQQQCALAQDAAQLKKVLQTFTN